MAKTQKVFRLTQDAIDELEALSANDTHKYNETSVIEALIHQAYAKRDANLKRIEPIRNAKGRTVGHRAMYGDHCVGEFDLMDKDGAQLALDRFAYEELSK